MMMVMKMMAMTMMTSATALVLASTISPRVLAMALQLPTT